MFAQDDYVYSLYLANVLITALYHRNMVHSTVATKYYIR